VVAQLADGDGCQYDLPKSEWRDSLLPPDSKANGCLVEMLQYGVEVFGVSRLAYLLHGGTTRFILA
jgi:hypothetical protein